MLLYDSTNKYEREVYVRVSNSESTGTVFSEEKEEDDGSESASNKNRGGDNKYKEQEGHYRDHGVTEDGHEYDEYYEYDEYDTGEEYNDYERQKN